GQYPGAQLHRDVAIRASATGAQRELSASSSDLRRAGELIVGPLCCWGGAVRRPEVVRWGGGGGRPSGSMCGFARQAASRSPAATRTKGRVGRGHQAARGAGSACSPRSPLSVLLIRQRERDVLAGSGLGEPFPDAEEAPAAARDRDVLAAVHLVNGRHAFRCRIEPDRK